MKAGESLLSLVHDLKLSLIANDFPAMNRAVQQRRQQLSEATRLCQEQIIELTQQTDVDGDIM